MHAEQFGVFKWASNSSSETKGPNAWIGCKLSSKAGVPARTRHSFDTSDLWGNTGFTEVSRSYGWRVWSVAPRLSFAGSFMSVLSVAWDSRASSLDAKLSPGFNRAMRR